jgi:acyl-CoA reductase-like NAD-dependent aldehyde dehydrogenase
LGELLQDIQHFKKLYQTSVTLIAAMLHFPILRKGEPYKSIDVIRTPHHRTRELFVEISQANAGLIRRDLLDQRTPKAALDRFTVEELTEIAARAADLFLHAELPLGDSRQSPQQYVEQLSATTGMPYVMVRRNMSKISGVMSRMDRVLSGLSRKLDPRILDSGFGEVEGQAVSYFPRTQALGVVLPNNSPGVHSLWAPAFALKIPLVLKPGSAEPWTPYRMVQAFIKAGAPKEAFSLYPADHAGGSEILRRCGRGMVFGDVGSTKVWQNDPRIEVHGPGYSKLLIGADEADNWEQYLDVMEASIVQNGGRSCVNASGIWVTKHSAEIADALAARLAKIVPLAADDENAQIAPFADGAAGKRISAMVDQDLEGASDVTARLRGDKNRVVEYQGCTYLLPTIVHCAADHPLANREFLFPFASVVEVPEDSLPEAMGPSLVVTAVTNNPKLRHRLLASPEVGRLNFGAVQTNVIDWDQPHEGNLFDHLYARRAFQMAG